MTDVQPRHEIAPDSETQAVDPFTVAVNALNAASKAASAIRQNVRESPLFTPDDVTLQQLRELQIICGITALSCTTTLELIEQVNRPHPEDLPPAQTIY